MLPAIAVRAMVDATTVVELCPFDLGQDVPDPGGQEKLAGAESTPIFRHDLERGSGVRCFAG